MSSATELLLVKSLLPCKSVRSPELSVSHTDTRFVESVASPEIDVALPAGTGGAMAIMKLPEPSATADVTVALPVEPAVVCDLVPQHAETPLADESCSPSVVIEKPVPDTLNASPSPPSKPRANKIKQSSTLVVTPSITCEVLEDTMLPGPVT